MECDSDMSSWSYSESSHLKRWCSIGDYLLHLSDRYIDCASLWATQEIQGLCFESHLFIAKGIPSFLTWNGARLNCSALNKEAVIVI